MNPPALIADSNTRADNHAELLTRRFRDAAGWEYRVVDTRLLPLNRVCVALVGLAEHAPAAPLWMTLAQAEEADAKYQADRDARLRKLIETTAADLRVREQLFLTWSTYEHLPADERVMHKHKSAEDAFTASLLEGLLSA